MELNIKVKPNVHSIEVHLQLSNNRHLLDGVQVGAGSLWPTSLVSIVQLGFNRKQCDYDGKKCTSLP
jgi:hypothetical protein